MSEYSDVLYDPGEHTHKSCLQEVWNCDLVVLIVGARFGSSIKDAELLADASRRGSDSIDVDITQGPMSITQAEALTAFNCRIPVYTFVEAGVYHDYQVYRRNCEVADKIVYPSIQNQATAGYIFEFIRRIRHFPTNNALMTFQTLENITYHLRKQWSILFRERLKDNRTVQEEKQRIESLSRSFESLTAAFLSTVEGKSKDVAKAVVRYRELMNLFGGLTHTNGGLPARDILTGSSNSFLQVLHSIGLTAACVSHEKYSGSSHLFILSAEELIYSSDITYEILLSLERDWDEFTSLEQDVRQLVYAAYFDNGMGKADPLLRRVSSKDSITLKSVFASAKEDQEEMQIIFADPIEDGPTPGRERPVLHIDLLRLDVRDGRLGGSR